MSPGRPDPASGPAGAPGTTPTEEGVAGDADAPATSGAGPIGRTGRSVDDRSEAAAGVPTDRSKQPAPSAARSTHPRRRVAVVGLGDISALHLAAIADLPDADLVAVCDTDAARCAEVAERLGVPGFASHGELLERVRPDVVHVCTPHATHGLVGTDALAAGAHVLTEKPLDATLAAARAFADAARAAYASAGRKTGVCLQNRYNATTLALRDALASGEFGSPVGARAGLWWHRTPEYYAAAPWRGTWAGSGGGVLMNQAIHTIDLLGLLLGPPLEVAGHAATYGLPVEVEDTAAMSLLHPGGLRSTLTATNLHASNAPVLLEVGTTRGALRIDDGTLTWHPAAAGAAIELAAEPAVDGARAYWGASHGALIVDFHARLADPEPFWIDPDAALPSLAALREVYAASGLIDPRDR